MLLSLAGSMACSDDNNDVNTITITKEQQNQTVYADETAKTIRFTAAEAWRTKVEYVATKADATADNWVTLDPPEGEAGEVSIHVTLDLNNTGSDRRAEVKITCGSTTITVTIEQKGKTADGEVPVPLKKVSTVEIREIINSEDGSSESKDLYTFRYDEKGRLTEQSLLEDSGEETLLQLSYDVAGKVKVTEKGEDEYWTVTLNDKGYATQLEVKGSYGGYNDRVYTFSYNADGHLAQESWKNDNNSAKTEYIDYSWKNGNFAASVYYSKSNEGDEDEDDEVDLPDYEYPVQSLSLSGGEWRDTLESGYTYLIAPENNKLNIDPNLFVSSLGNNNYNANSNAYHPRKGRLDLLALWGLAGERSRQYVNGPSAYEGLASSNRPDQEYYYVSDWTSHPLQYEFDKEGYLLSVTDKADKKIYKVVTATGAQTLVKETYDETTYYFTYKD